MQGVVIDSFCKHIAEVSMGVMDRSSSKGNKGKEGEVRSDTGRNDTVSSASAADMAGIKGSKCFKTIEFIHAFSIQLVLILYD